MITPELAAEIWKCHREINSAEKLLQEIKDTVAKYGDQRPFFPKNLEESARREFSLQLGVPSGHGSHSLYSVTLDLALPVIHAHIAKMKAQLVSLNQQALLQLHDTRVSLEGTARAAEAHS